MIIDNKYFIVILTVLIINSASLINSLNPKNDVSSINSVDNAITFDKTFDTDTIEKSYSIIKTSDEGFLLVGEMNNNSLVVKTDSNGSIEWKSIFGGHLIDSLNTVIETNDGSFIVGGNSYIFQNDYDFLLAKIDSNGIVKWNYTYGGEKIDQLTSFTETSDNGIIMCGTKTSYDINSSSYKNYNISLIKTNSEGIVEWNSTIFDYKSYYTGKIIQTNYDGFFVATYAYTGDFYDITLIKVNNTGHKVWEKVFNKNMDYIDSIDSILLTNDNSLLLAGVMFNSYYCLIKTDYSGNIIWEKTLGYNHANSPVSLVQLNNNEFIIAGRIGAPKLPRLQMAGIKVNYYLSNYLAKFNNNGELKWEILFDIKKVKIITTISYKEEFIFDESRFFHFKSAIKYSNNSIIFLATKSSNTTVLKINLKTISDYFNFKVNESFLFGVSLSILICVVIIIANRMTNKK